MAENDNLLVAVLGIIAGAALAFAIAALFLNRNSGGVIIERHQPQPGDILAILPASLRNLA